MSFHIKIHRKRSVSSKAFYVALAVTEEGRRDVLGIFNIPTESATGWRDIFDTLKERGVQKIGLMVADGIKGLDVVVGEIFSGTPLQRCVTHLKRNTNSCVTTPINWAPEIQSMIYTTNWIERLNRDFKRVTRMRTAMPNEESVLTLMGSVAMEHKAFDQLLPNIT